MGIIEMGKQPLVSVVIPFYNGVDWLNEAVGSVLEQTYSNYEIIVVNDGSKENIDKFIEKYGDKIVYLYQKNKGAGVARNYGIENARGQYIAFLDSDDIWKKNKLEEQISYMESNPQIMWSHSSYETFGNDENGIVDTSVMEGMIFPNCLCCCKIATPCVVIRKKVLDDNKTLRFCETMRYGQDFYLWVLLGEKYEIGHLDTALCMVRMRGGNAAKRAYVMLRAKSELWENIFEKNVIEKRRIPYSSRWAYTMCKINYAIVDNLSNTIENQKLIEYCSKVLYALPYFIFRIIRR